MVSKKQQSIDASIYVKQLTDAGIDKQTATSTVNSLIESVNEVMKDDSIEAKQVVIGIRLRELIAASRSNKYVMTVVAVGPRKDSNDYKRNLAIRTYNQDPMTALSQGMVKIVNERTAGAIKANDGKYIVALDTRKFWDEAGTKPNNGFGKPLKVSISREILGIAEDGSLVKAYGDVDLEVGYQYELLGRVNEKTGALYINTEVKPKKLKAVADLYDALYNAAKNSEIATDIDGALQMDQRGTIIVQGNALRVSAMSNGKHKLTITGGYGSTLSVMPTDDASEKMISDVMTGADVLVIGNMRESKDPQFAPSLNAISVIANTKVNSIEKALEALRAKDQ